VFMTKSLNVTPKTTMLTSLVFQPVTFSDYSQSSTQPVRLVAGSWRRDHVTSLLRDRHWLPVKQRVEYKLCMMVHRCLYGDAPSYLAELIMPSAAATVRPGLTSSASSSVAVPRTISSLGDRSFAAAGARAWNKLPPPLRRVYFPATFKRQLKTFLYNHAFNSHC